MLHEGDFSLLVRVQDASRLSTIQKLSKNVYEKKRKSIGINITNLVLVVANFNNSFKLSTCKKYYEQTEVVEKR